MGLSRGSHPGGACFAERLSPKKNLQKTTNFILRKVFARDWKSVQAVVASFSWKTHPLHAPARSFFFLSASNPHPPSPPGSAPSFPSRKPPSAGSPLVFRVSCLVF